MDVHQTALHAVVADVTRISPDTNKRVTQLGYPLFILFAQFIPSSAEDTIPPA